MPPTLPTLPTLSTSEPAFATEASHELVRYSQVWEDHAVVERALEVGPDDDVLAIASAGDNVLSLLRHSPRSVVAIDLSPAQVALTELKLAAVRDLTSAELAAFLGARPSRDRAALYARLAPGLSARSRAHWGRHRELIRAGVTRCGLLDRYILAFQAAHLSRLVSPDAIRRLLGLADPEAQARLFEDEFTVLEPAFREWFGRAGLTGHARDASQFAQVGTVDVGGVFWRRIREVATTLPARGNFYLEWLLTGEYADLETGPPYLRPAVHDRIRGRVDRVRVECAEVGSYLLSAGPGSFDALNLSDAFEYLSPAAASTLRDRATAALRPRGRMAYWNMFVERTADHPDPAQPRGLERRQTEADTAFAGDRVPFYTAFRLDRRSFE